MSSPRTDNLHTMATGMERRAVRVVKKADVPPRSRSELTLLYELIQRNPERAKVFLERLRDSVAA